MAARFFRRKTVALALVVTVGLIPSLVLAPAASAGGPVLRANLVVIAGEDPSIPGQFLFEGDARFILPNLVKVTIVGLDPARFPAGPACSADVKVGGVGAQGLQLILLAVGDLEKPFPVPVTALEFAQNGIVKAGDRAEVRIRCTVGGIRHETRMQGTLAPV